MKVELEQDRNVQIPVSDQSRKSEHLSKVAWDWLKTKISPDESVPQKNLISFCDRL